MLRLECPSRGLGSGDHVGPCGVMPKTPDDAACGADAAAADLLRDDRDRPFVDHCGPDHLEHRVAGAFPLGRPVVLPLLVIAHGGGDMRRPWIVALAAVADALEESCCQAAFDRYGEHRKGYLLSGLQFNGADLARFHERTQWRLIAFHADDGLAGSGITGCGFARLGLDFADLAQHEERQRCRLSAAHGPLTCLPVRCGMAEVTNELLTKLLEQIRDEQRALRNEMRRLAENQMDTTRAIRALRDELELMIRTEIGGLFAHLETRLEARIAERLKD